MVKLTPYDNNLITMLIKKFFLKYRIVPIAVLLALVLFTLPCSSNSNNGRFTANTTEEMSPHSFAPLSGLATIATSRAAQVEVTVMGEIPVKSSFLDFSTERVVPIIGLYPDRLNTIILDITDESGETITKMYTLQTEPLPDPEADPAPDGNVIMPQITIVKSSLPEDDSRLFLVSGNGADFIFDRQGNIRWYLGDDPERETERPTGGLIYTQLANGNFALGSNRHVGNSEQNPIGYWFKTLVEIDLSGRIINRYDIENYIHHAVVEDSHHNLLVATSAPGTTSEDVAIIINRNDGRTLTTFDFGDLLKQPQLSDGTTDTESTRAKAVVGGRPDDWAHINSITQDTRPDGCHCFLFSVRQQSAIANIQLDDYDGIPKVQWIIANREGWDPDIQDQIIASSDPSMSDDLPADDLPAGQHSMQFLNEDRSLVVFDNGANRGLYPPETPAGETQPADQYNTNEVRHYEFSRDNQVTVGWRWSPENSEYKSHRLGSARYLKESDSYLILLPAYADPTAPGSENSILPARIIEVRKSDKETIFEAEIENLGSVTASFQVFIPELTFSASTGSANGN